MSVDLDKIADGAINAIKGFIAKAIGELSARIDRLDSVAKEWKPIDVDAVARQAASLIPEPKPGVDGKSIDIEVVRGIIQVEVASIPRPENGKDADAASVIAAAKAAVDALPKPMDGKDADPELLARMVKEAVDAIPRPQDGKSITADDFLPMIAEQVAAAVAKIPIPKDGKDADPDQMKEMVEVAVAALPSPVAGKDADPAEIAKMVEEAVAAIPKPKEWDVDPAVVEGIVRDEVKNWTEGIPLPLNGKDADPEQIRSMVNEAVAAIPTPKDGKSVPIEEVQRMVDEAVAKAIAGIVVKDGTPGRDALALDILPMIDMEKSYPRNIYATHKGGLWRSFETTHGMKGWECIVDGIAKIEIEAPDERTCVVMVQRSSGTEERKDFTVPGVIDKGIFREGDSYKRGDGVTFGGSWFLAQKDQPTGKPGESNDWRLAAKRGRDGRDATSGELKPSEPVRL